MGGRLVSGVLLVGLGASDPRGRAILIVGA